MFRKNRSNNRKQINKIRRQERIKMHFYRHASNSEQSLEDISMYNVYKQARSNEQTFLKDFPNYDAFTSELFENLKKCSSVLHAQ